MTLEKLLDRLCVDLFKVVTFRDYAVIVLYNSRKTSRDIPQWMKDSVVESYDVNDNGTLIIEI